MFDSCTKALNGVSATHVMPVASGDMLQSFLNNKQSRQHSFVGIMTGNLLTRPWLKFKFRHYDNVILKNRVEINERDYLVDGQRFFLI